MQFFGQLSIAPRFRASLVTLLFFAAVPLKSAAHGDYHEVVKKLAAQLRVSPSDPNLRHKLALAHINHGDWGLGMASLDQLEALAPSEFPIRFLRGRAWNIAGKPKKALSFLNRFLLENPQHAEAHFQSGISFRKLGKIPEAVGEFRLALKLSQKPQIQNFQQLAQVLHLNRQSAAASKVIDQGVTTSGPSPSLLRTGFELEMESQQWDRALARINALQKIAPTPEPWLKLRAEALEQAGRARQARVVWKELLDHLDALASLKKGTSQNQAIRQAALQALGLSRPEPVSIPPAR